MRILISAGEASGEMYGAQLIQALRRCAGGESAELRFAGPFDSAQGRQPGACPELVEGAAIPTQTLLSPKSSLEFFGVGGDRMRAAGCETVVDAKDLSVVGITEILSHLPKIYGLYQRLIKEADQRKPDIAVVIDSPAFNWRVARQMKRRGIPVVYYVAPQFWAWRQKRVKLLRDYIDKALVIFPFEEEFYRERGVDATFVGHPLADLPEPTSNREDYAAQNSIDSAKQWITIMPGSRVKEVRMNLPTILEATGQLGSHHEFLLPVAPTLDRNFLHAFVAQHRVTLVAESLPALWHSRAGIIASGTATVEAAMMRLPFVMVYRVSSLTYLIGKPWVKVPHFAMVNLIAGKEVVPELVQHDFSAANVVARLREILPDGATRAQMLEDLIEVKERLRGPMEVFRGRGATPAERAAEIILSFLGPRAS